MMGDGWKGRDRGMIGEGTLPYSVHSNTVRSQAISRLAGFTFMVIKRNIDKTSRDDMLDWLKVGKI